MSKELTSPDSARVSKAVFRIADHVLAGICNRPCLCLVQALLKTPRPSADRPLAKSQRRPFLIRQFRRSRPLKNDDGPLQEAFQTPRPRSGLGRDQKGGGRVISEHCSCWEDVSSVPNCRLCPYGHRRQT